MNYKQIHDRIIENAKNSNRSKGDGNYYEAHHIVPRCMDGEGRVNQWRTHENIVLLTAKEHFVIHKLLVEIHPNEKKLVLALWAMTNMDKAHKRDYKINSKEYERIRIECAEIMTGEGNPMFNRNHTDEALQKMSEDKIGDKNPMYDIKRPEHSERMTGENNPFYKKTHSEETRKIISEKAIGRKNSEETRKKIGDGVRGKMEGGKHPSAKKVICVNTHKIYGCAKDALGDLDITYGTLLRWLNKPEINKSSLRYV